MISIRHRILRHIALLLRKALVLLSLGSIPFSCGNADEPGLSAETRKGLQSDSALKINRPRPVIPEAIIDESLMTPTLYGVVPVYDPGVQPVVDYGVLPDYSPSLDNRRNNEQ